MPLSRFLMMSWDSTEMVSHYLPQISGWRSVNLSYFLTRRPPRVQYSSREGGVDL